MRIDCIRGSSAAQKARGQQPCVCSVACGRYHACQQQKWASVGSKHPIGSCWSRQSGSWAVRACIRHGHEDGKKTQIWHQKQRQQPPILPWVDGVWVLTSWAAIGDHCREFAASLPPRPPPRPSLRVWWFGHRKGTISARVTR